MAAPPIRSVFYNHIKKHNERLLTKPFIQYTVDELQEIIENNDLKDSLIDSVNSVVSEEPEERDTSVAQPAPPLEPESAPSRSVARPQAVPPAFVDHETPQQLADRLGVPLADRGEERAGLNFNTHDGRTQPIRVDSQGRIWFQDEVRKAAIPMPRARRVTTHVSSGFKTIEKRTKDGKLDESFEVAGDEAREMRIKVTLQSWQTGAYRDRSLPFLVHIYNEVRGFDMPEVIRFYGGEHHVPASIKRIYVGNLLCYDIDSTRETMNREYREKILGRMN